MDIVINAAGKGTALHNFWNNMHFHPTDAVEDLWGKQIIDQVASDRSAQYVRLYTMEVDTPSRHITDITRTAHGRVSDSSPSLIRTLRTPLLNS